MVKHKLNTSNTPAIVGDLDDTPTAIRLEKKYWPQIVIVLSLLAIIISLVLPLLFIAAASRRYVAVEIENGNSSGVQVFADSSAAGGNAVRFTAPQTVSGGVWAGPASLSNTGPAAGTKFTIMSPREFSSADNGKTFDGIQINVGNGQEFLITGSNITFKNCKIVYTGNVHSPNGFIFVGKSWDSSIRPKNIVFDHCIIDAGDRHEYGLTARHGQFAIRYSQIRGASHNIESAGDLDVGTTTTIYRNYIYDYNDTPYGSPPHLGHANGIYFTGNNGTVIIEENTIVGNRFEMCTVGWSYGPGAGCYEFGGTGAVTVYADEDSNLDKNYIVKNNNISGGGYYSVRFYGQSSGIASVQITGNVFSALAGWPKHTIDGGIYVFDGNITSRVVTGNSWGSDTTCYVSPAQCPGLPNL